MRYIITLVLLCSLSRAQSNAPQSNTTETSAPAASPQSIPIDQENARKAKSLLDQMIQALGGQAYLSIQDISQQGRAYSFYHGESNSAGTLFWRFYKYPDKERIELTKQRDVAYVYNGDKGCEITYKGSAMQEQKVMSDDLRRREHSLDWVIRKWLSEPGLALFYDGPSVAGEKPTDQVTILNSKNDSVTLYIDSSTHLPVKKTYSWRDPTDKLRNTEDEVFDGYRMVQGINTPFSITRFLNGDMSNQRFLNTVAYNTGVNESMFITSATYDPNKPQKKR